MRVLEKCHQRGCKTGRERIDGDGGKIEWKSSEVNTRAVSKGQIKLIGKFKMVAGDVISIRGQVMEHTYISTGIKREFGYPYSVISFPRDLYFITNCTKAKEIHTDFQNPSYSTVNMWINQFKYGLESIEITSIVVNPSCAITPEIIAKGHDIILKDCWLKLQKL